MTLFYCMHSCHLTNNEERSQLDAETSIGNHQCSFAKLNTKKRAEKKQMERHLFKDRRDKYVVGFLKETTEYGRR